VHESVRVNVAKTINIPSKNRLETQEVRKPFEGLVEGRKIIVFRKIECDCAIDSTGVG
jgi:hypothetical protein